MSVKAIGEKKGIKLPVAKKKKSANRGNAEEEDLPKGVVRSTVLARTKSIYLPRQLDKGATEIPYALVVVLAKKKSTLIIPNSKVAVRAQKEIAKAMGIISLDHGEPENRHKWT